MGVLFKKAWNKKKDLSFFQVKNVSANSADLYIYGDIIDDTWADWVGSGYVLPMQIKQQLDELDGKDLTVYINSDGGLVSAGLAIANMLARRNGNTTGVIDGWAASIASIIFMSCDTKQMRDNTFMMIHRPACGVYGNADDLQKGIDVLNVIQQGLMATYMNCVKDGITEEQIQADMNAETWYTAADAAEKFNIEIIPAAAEAVAFAGSNYSGFAKIPAIATKQIKSQVDAAKVAAQKKLDDERQAKAAAEQRAIIQNSIIESIILESEVI